MTDWYWGTLMMHVLTHLWVKTQGDQLVEAKRGQVISSCDEGEEVFKGKTCPTLWLEEIFHLNSSFIFLNCFHSFLTVDQGEDRFPVCNSSFLSRPQWRVWTTEVNGEEQFELFQGEELLLLCARHHRHKRLPIGLHQIPESTTAVQTLSELRDHTCNPEQQQRDIWCPSEIMTVESYVCVCVSNLW